MMFVCFIWHKRGRKSVESLQKILRMEKRIFMIIPSLMPSHLPENLPNLVARVVRNFSWCWIIFFTLRRTMMMALKWCNWIFSLLCFRCCFFELFLTTFNTAKSRLRACLLLSRTHRLDTKNYCHIAYLSTDPRGMDFVREENENIINYGNGRVELSVGVSWKMPHRHEKGISRNTKISYCKKVDKTIFSPSQLILLYNFQRLACFISIIFL